MKMKLIAVMILILIATVAFSFFTYVLFVFNIISLEKEALPTGDSSVIIIANLSSGDAPLNVQFKSLPQYFDTNLTYFWDFGDGATSNEQHPHHIYSTAGDYMCILTVQDNKGQFSDKLIISVYENNPPFIKILVDKASGNRPMVVNFDAAGFDTDGSIVSYDWEIIYPPFFSSQKVVTHTEKNFSERFILKGFYEVRLIVKDDFGHTATDYIKIQVLGTKLELLLQTGMYYRAILGPFFKKMTAFIDRHNSIDSNIFEKRIFPTLSSFSINSCGSREAFVESMDLVQAFLRGNE